MKDRIIQFLASEKISPSEFADKIGVQRSSMSHILNGRNYPSAAFLQKMLQAYPVMNPRWLMIGEGNMNLLSSAASQVSTVADIRNDESVYETQPSQVKDQDSGNPSFSDSATKSNPLIAEQKEQDSEMEKSTDPVSIRNKNALTNDGYAETEQAAMLSNQSTVESSIPSARNGIEQVLFFFNDKTFRVYLPS